MGHASKGMLVLRPVHAADRKLSPIRNPAFRMWPLGPSCFDGIRTRITPKTGHPDRLNDEAMLRIRCWRGGSVQTTEVQACALTIVPLRPNMAAGGWWR